MPVISGTLKFESQSSKTVTFSTPLDDAEYTVILSTKVFSPLRVVSKTALGFQVQAGSAVSGEIGYDVFV